MNVSKVSKSDRNWFQDSFGTRFNRFLWVEKFSRERKTEGRRKIRREEEKRREEERKG